MQELRTISHVDCSLRFDARSYFFNAFCATALLLAAGLAINYRTVWCQIQAGAIIAVTIVALACREHERKERTEKGIKQQHLVYCLNCRRTSSVALVFGSRVAAERAATTIYEKLFVPIFSCSLMLGTWVVWVAYSALFHEGAHEKAFDQAIEVIFGFSENLPSVVHSMRALALFAAAVFSLFAKQSFSLWHAILILACSLFPPASGTAQELTLAELTARTALYATLFIVAETFELNARYCAWLRASRAERNGVLLAVQNALKGDRGADRSTGAPLSIGIDLLTEVDVGRAYSLHTSAARVVTALRCGWILIVPCGATILGVIQVGLMLYLVARERTLIELAIRETRLDLVHFSSAPVRTVTSDKLAKQTKECLVLTGNTAEVAAKVRVPIPMQAIPTATPATAMPMTALSAPRVSSPTRPATPSKVGNLTSSVTPLLQPQNQPPQILATTSARSKLHLKGDASSVSENSTATTATSVRLSPSNLTPSDLVSSLQKTAPLPMPAQQFSRFPSAAQEVSASLNDPNKPPPRNPARHNQVSHLLPPEVRRLVAQNIN